MSKASDDAEKQAREDAFAAEQAADAALAASLRDKLVSAGIDDLLAQELVTMTQATLLKWGFCPNCRQKVQVDYPDSKSRLPAVQVILDRLLGKPKESKELTVNLPQKPVGEMTIPEREAYLEQLRQREIEGG